MLANQFCIDASRGICGETIRQCDEKIVDAFLLDYLLEEGAGLWLAILAQERPDSLRGDFAFKIENQVLE